MNRKQLIAWARKQGFDGTPTLEAIKSFLVEQGYDPANLDVKTADGVLRVSADNVWKKAAPVAFDGTAEDSDETETKPGRKAKSRREADADGDEDEADKLRGEIADLEARFKSAQEKWRLSDGNERLSEQEQRDNKRTKGAGGAKSVIATANRKAYDRRAAAGETIFPDADVAELYAAHARLAISNTFGQDYAQKAADLEILKKSQVEYDNTLGGNLVPAEYSTYMVSLKERYSMARALFRTVPMSRDVQTFPKDTGDLTVYAPGEGVAITASDKTVGTVNLTSKKLATLTTISSELMRDSAINVAEWLAKGIGYAFAKAEEQAFFIGDGTSTYYNWTGVAAAIKALSGTIANIAGLQVGTGNAYSELVLNDFIFTMGLLPEFEGVSGDPVWIMNRRFYFNVCVRLEMAVGGVTAAEVEGRRVNTFLGHEVKFVRSMPRVEANSQVCALFGHPELAATIGDVTGGVSIDNSSERYFDQDLIAFRGIERVAFSAHDVGNASATEASRNPGPIVGLITAAA